MTVKKVIFKRTICFLLAAATVFVSSGLSALSEGIDFNPGEVVFQAAVPPVPYSWEAELTVAKDAPDQRLGTIIGNYYDVSVPSVSFEIREFGNVGIWYSDGSGNSERVIFKSFDLRTGKKTRVRVDVDGEKGLARLTVDGEVKETASVQVPEVLLYDPLYVGGDQRRGNQLCLSDFVTVHTLCCSNGGGVLFSYDFSRGLTDLTGNGYDLAVSKTERWASFSPGQTYTLDGTLAAFPKYVEAGIRLTDRFYSEYSGVIFGNRGEDGDFLNFEVYTCGTPRIYCRAGEKVIDVRFNHINLANGRKKKVAFIIGDADAEGMAEYAVAIDGTVLQKATAEAIPESISLSRSFCIGGDNSPENGNCFRGILKSIELYSDASKTERIASFKMSDGSGNLIDESGRYSVITNDAAWKRSTPNADKKYAYSLAIVGDVQTITGFYPDSLHTISDWLLANKSEKKIEHVFYMGDLTEHDTEAEWELAAGEVRRIDGEIPYTVVRGNHDSKKRYRAYVGEELNYYRELKIGTNEYLLMCLDYGASDKELAWAGEVIAEHHDSRVIILTHAYLCRDGSTIDENDNSPPSKTGGLNDGDDFWDKFIKYYPNIELVICGHDPAEGVVVTTQKGLYGNTVTQLLVDPQQTDLSSPGGMVCLLCFNEDGTECFYDYYSCVKGLYYKPSTDCVFSVGEGACHAHVAADADGNGKFNNADVLYLAQGEPTTPEGSVKVLYDLSGDGKLDAEDSVALLKNIFAPEAYGLDIRRAS